MDALLSGKIDVGFTRPLEPPFDRSLSAELLYADPIVVAMPADHPLAAESVQITALASEPVVMCDRESNPALFDSILTLCSKAGYSPHIINTSSTWSGVLTLVESGEGIAMVPSGVRFLQAPGVVFATIKPETTYIGISIAWKPEHENPILQNFLTLVRANKDRIQSSGGN